MSDTNHSLMGPLNPNDQMVTGSFNINEPGLYTIASTTYRATRGADGDFEGTMRERCTNCGGSRKGIGIPLYGHPWCMACLRSFNEDGTLKAESVTRWDADRRDLDNRVNPDTFVLMQTPKQPRAMMESDITCHTNHQLDTKAALELHNTPPMRKLSEIPKSQLLYTFALILTILSVLIFALIQ